MGRRELAAGLGAAMQGLGQGIMSMGQYKQQEDVNEMARELQNNTLQLERDRLALAQDSAKWRQKFDVRKHNDEMWVKGKEFVQRELKFALDEKAHLAQAAYMTQLTENIHPDSVKDLERYKNALRSRTVYLGHQMKMLEILETADGNHKNTWLQNMVKANFGEEGGAEKSQTLFDAMMADTANETAKYIQAGEEQFNAAGDILDGQANGQQGPVENPVSRSNMFSQPEREGIGQGGIEVDVPEDDVQSRLDVIQQETPSTRDALIAQGSEDPFIESLKQIAGDPDRVQEALRARMAEDETFTEAMAAATIKEVLGPSAVFHALTPEQIAQRRGQSTSGVGVLVDAAVGGSQRTLDPRRNALLAGGSQ